MQKKSHDDVTSESTERDPVGHRAEALVTIHDDGSQWLDRFTVSFGNVSVAKGLCRGAAEKLASDLRSEIAKAIRRELFEAIRRAWRARRPLEAP